MTQAIPNLGELGSIPAEYVHTEKTIRPDEELLLPTAVFKWYDIFRADQDVPKDVREEAQDWLRSEEAAGRLELRQEIGYALLHRAGDKYFLMICVWRNINELHTGLYFKDDAGFLPYPVRAEVPRPTMDILELDVTSHERRGWSRYLSSDRDEAAKQAYLDDRCTGILV
ncbi:hypothetical protein ACFRKE_16050 [Kitasatospora indigofera]|uniref:Uncharacterized protein n=1 Tax=Kitasatospora indigofera TaxID=67307 RepID=A0A919G0E8_9ACTN|nr:hypothetical protein [Kitasatospora indigofera]GHH75872.1 hypothetical protein GCM10018781_45790 [Kitasatospora indigofera]